MHQRLQDAMCRSWGIACSAGVLHKDQKNKMVCVHPGKLFALGVLIQGGVASEGHFPVWDLARLRVFGVLQRIAICFLCASLLVLYVPECQLPKLEVWLTTFFLLSKLC